MTLLLDEITSYIAARRMIWSCIFQPCYLFCHFPGPAFSGRSIADHGEGPEVEYRVAVVIMGFVNMTYRHTYDYNNARYTVCPEKSEPPKNLEITTDLHGIK